MAWPEEKHGHVRPLLNGLKARCGGPSLCDVCKQEAAALFGEQAALRTTSLWVLEQQRKYSQTDPRWKILGEVFCYLSSTEHALPKTPYNTEPER